MEFISENKISEKLVNSYDEINLNLLNEFSSNLNLEEINLEKLNINWWINKMRQSEISSTKIKFTSKPKKIQTMYLVNKLKLKYKIKSLNKKVGVSLNPDSEINKISNYLDGIDLVLVMSVFPGFGGQKFIPEVLNKIKTLKELKDKNNYNFDIEVDGGVNFSNSKDILKAGANILVSGTTVFKENNGDIKKNIETLKLV